MLVAEFESKIKVGNSEVRRDTSLHQNMHQRVYLNGIVIRCKRNEVIELFKYIHLHITDYHGFIKKM